MVTANHDGTNNACRFVITGWADGTPGVAATAAACLGTLTVQAHTVSGQSSTLVDEENVVDPLVATPLAVTTSFAAGDWNFRLLTGTAPNRVMIAQAWLISGDRVEWTMSSATGERAVYLDSGAIYSEEGGTIFLEKEASIGDTAFGSTYYGLWLRSLTAGSLASVSGQGNYQIYLSLVGNYVRVDQTNVHSIRYDISGPLAEAWCNGLMIRNGDLSGATYDSAAADCGAIAPLADGVRAVCFAKVALAADACASTGGAFTFRFLNARIHTSLAV